MLTISVRGGAVRELLSGQGVRVVSGRGGCHHAGSWSQLPTTAQAGLGWLNMGLSGVFWPVSLAPAPGHARCCFCGSALILKAVCLPAFGFSQAEMVIHPAHARLHA